MPQPTPYSRTYDFTNYQELYPDQPLPAAPRDANLDLIAQATSEITTRLPLIQRDDGNLANGVVKYETLSQTVVALLGSAILPRGDWVTATAYSVLDLIEISGSSYICSTAHTSGVFATDYAANKWTLWAAGSGVSVNNSNWSGAQLTVPNGGTGVTTITGLVKGNGASAFTAAIQGTDYYKPGGTDMVVGDGGSGRSTATPYAVICGGTTVNSPLQSVGSEGAAGQVLTSNGAANLPSFQDNVPPDGVITYVKIAAAAIAGLSDWAAGTASKLLAAANFLPALAAALGVSKYYESAEITLTANTLSTLAHSFGSIPKEVWVVLRCKTAEHGYAIGDEIILDNWTYTQAATDDYNNMLACNATNVYLRTGNGGASGALLRHLTTGAVQVPTAANWRWVVRARA